jgi:hypothetical protein
MKEAATVLEAKANLRAQEAINLLQVGLSHAYITGHCWEQALQIVRAVHLSATPKMLDSTHDVDIATLGGFTSAFF